MKGIKAILAFGAGYASLRWAAATFAHLTQGGVLWALPMIATLVLALLCGVWLAWNWE